jgi:cytochrome c-type biogenesis protein CcmF
LALLGQIFLYLAFIILIFSIIFSVLAIKKKSLKYIEVGKNLLLSSSFLIWTATISLVYAFVTNDYTIKFVSHYSDSTTGFWYKVSALWAGQAGSLLFWTAILALFIIILFLTYPKNEKIMKVHIQWIVALSLMFFLYIVLFTSNPFETFLLTEKVPLDGVGLNPQLQTFSMLFHPPLLYAGYVGFNIVIAFTFAALITGKLDSEWLIMSRNWALISWLFLTVGNVLGAQWAYTELGWGGFWAWDPVENASFVPWLTSTAYLHSANLQLKRGIFKKWTISLMMITFGLTILGTFITRSGFIDSVHAFAKSSIGWYFIGFLIVFVIFSIFLILYRLDKLKTNPKLESFFSRENTYIFSNLAFLVGVFIVLWGTLAPNIFKAFGEKISINQTYFNEVFSPIGLFIFLLMGLAPAFSWKKITKENFKSRLLPALIMTIVFTILIIVFKPIMIKKMSNIYSLLAISLSFFNVIIIIYEFSWAFKYLKREKYTFKNAIIWLFVKRNTKYSGYLVHLGIVMIFIGLSGTAFNTEKSKMLGINQSLKIDGYELRFKKIYLDSSNIDKDQVYSVIDLYKNGNKIDVLKPHKNFYNNAIEGVTSEVEIYSTFIKDLYVVLEGFDIEKDLIFIRAYINPLIIWLWIGGFVIMISSIPLFFRRKRTLEDDSVS